MRFIRARQSAGYDGTPPSPIFAKYAAILFLKKYTAREGAAFAPPQKTQNEARLNEVKRRFALLYSARLKILKNSVKNIRYRFGICAFFGDHIKRIVIVNEMHKRCGFQNFVGITEQTAAV